MKANGSVDSQFIWFACANMQSKIEINDRIRFDNCILYLKE